MKKYNSTIKIKKTSQKQEKMKISIKNIFKGIKFPWGKKKNKKNINKYQKHINKYQLTNARISTSTGPIQVQFT